MTTYARREIVSTRVEYGVESGSDLGTVLKVMNMAYADYCRRTGYDSRAVMPDDWCHVHACDDEVVFAFLAEKPIEVTS